MHQGCTDADEHSAEQDHAQNAPEQHAVLVKPWNTEETENGGDDEHVVHRQ